MSSVGLCSANGAESAQPLFSQIQTIGSFQTEAWIAPPRGRCRGPAAPSPKKTATTRSSPSSWTERGAGAEHEVRAERAALAEHAESRVDEVDGAAALAADAAAGPAEQVAEQGVRRHPLGQRVAEPAVGVEEVVLAAQRRDAAGLQPLLPQPGVPEAAEPVLLDVAVQQQLERADAGDFAVEIERVRVVGPRVPAVARSRLCGIPTATDRPDG